MTRKLRYVQNRHGIYCEITTKDIFASGVTPCDARGKQLVSEDGELHFKSKKEACAFFGISSYKLNKAVEERIPLNGKIIIYRGDLDKRIIEKAAKTSHKSKKP